MSNIISINKANSRKRYVRSLEYELIASLAFQQYVDKEEPRFESLLSIPLPERIPGLVNEYGLKRMYKLVKTVVNEFCAGVKLPKSKKLTDTKTSVLSCDLLLVAEEDQFSMEDLIIFFELAKKERFGKFKPLLTHYSIIEMLEQYRQKRYEAFMSLKEKQEAEVRLLGPAERISPEPTAIRQLFEGGRVIPFRGATG
jgi:hypothetical protein